MDLNDLLTMAKTIYGEARGEPLEGRIAVGWVIRNRLESNKWFGADTLADVCMRQSQFSCWNFGDPNYEKLESVTLDDPWYLECVYIAAGIMCGQMADPTVGATHYYAPGAVSRKPAWADGKEPCARFGGHLFFKDID